MADYNYVLNLFSLLLIIGILFIIMYGCQYQKHRKIEKFMDIDDYNKSLENEKTSQQIAELAIKVANDEISIETFTNMIDEGKFTKDDLTKIIDYVGNFEKKIT
jgi:hypothetical protein